MSWGDGIKGGRQFVALLLSIGILQIAGYWLSGSLVNGSGSLAIPQPDTSLYCQAAARVAVGHPFSYSAETAACTGTTSVLYPFVLAVPYLLGFKGASLVSAGFWLNAAFYLIFLAGWGSFIWRRYSNPLIRILSGVLIAVFPGTAYCSLAQSDVGFWLAISGLLAGTLASGKRIWYGLVLILTPWVRPEGMVCIFAFLLVSLGLWRQEGWRSRFLIAILGCLSIIGVFGLNYALTGHAQFSSVSNKGYLVTEALPMAIQRTAYDLILILKDLAFGQSNTPPRMFYAVPLVGAAFFWLGVFIHDWRKKGAAGELVLLLAALGGILTVAQSGWQNTNVDRYLAWIMPLLVILSAEGMIKAYELLRRHSPVAMVVLIVPLLFSICASISFWFLFFASSEDSEQIMAFGRDLDRIMPHNTSYGVTGWCGIAYTLPDRRCAHLSGIYSPEFTAKSLNGNLEILRNEPQTRFDFWLFASDDKFPEGFKQLQGRQLAVGPEGIEVSFAKWDAFDWGLSPHPDPRYVGITNKTLKGKIDVGYATDETKYDYTVIPRYHLRPFPVIARVDDLAGKKTFDTGRVIYGEDEMMIELETGKDVTLVMRTISDVKFSAKSLLYNINLTYAYSDPLELHIEVDGKEAGHAQANIAKKGFTDAVFTIPGKAITHSPCRISLHGDHVTFGYWFYQ